MARGSKKFSQTCWVIWVNDSMISTKNYTTSRSALRCLQSICENCRIDLSRNSATSLELISTLCLSWRIMRNFFSQNLFWLYESIEIAWRASRIYFETLRGFLNCVRNNHVWLMIPTPLWGTEYLFRIMVHYRPSFSHNPLPGCDTSRDLHRFFIPRQVWVASIFIRSRTWAHVASHEKLNWRRFQNCW